jgi:hypothetical protein
MNADSVTNRELTTALSVLSANAGNAYEIGLITSEQAIRSAQWDAERDLFLKHCK